MSQCSCKRAAQEIDRDLEVGSGGAVGAMPCTTLDEFEFERSALRPQHAAAIDRLARDVLARGAGVTVDIVGHTDPSGSDAFNLGLGLRRAREVEAALRARLAKQSPTIRQGITFQVTSRGEREAVPGPPTRRRRVVVCLRGGSPSPLKVCGPDATTWFVRTLLGTRTDPAVLAVLGAMRAARVACVAAGVSFARVMEGSVATALLAAARGAGAPPQPAAVTALLAQARPGLVELARLTAAVARDTATGSVDPRARGALSLVGAAAAAWAVVVRPNGRYDFKANVLRGLRAPGCAQGCPGTTTLCGLCVGVDVPGNILFGYLGRWLGYTPLALLLGSHLAQLLVSRRWDPAHDSAAITLGAGLPAPLTVRALCAAVQGARATLNVHQCRACAVPLSVASASPAQRPAAS